MDSSNFIQFRRREQVIVGKFLAADPIPPLHSGSRQPWRLLTSLMPRALGKWFYATLPDGPSGVRIQALEPDIWLVLGSTILVVYVSVSFLLCKTERWVPPPKALIWTSPVAQMVVSQQCRRPRFNPWVGKIPWRRKWQPTPVFLSGKSHGLKSLVG